MIRKAGGTHPAFRVLMGIAAFRCGFLFRFILFKNTVKNDAGCEGNNGKSAYNANQNHHGHNFYRYCEQEANQTKHNKQDQREWKMADSHENRVLNRLFQCTFEMGDNGKQVKKHAE